MQRVLLVAITLALTAPSLVRAEEQVPQSEAEVMLSYAPVVRNSTPSVVNIYATWVVERRASPFADDPFFSQFFDGYGRGVPRVQNSLGSGVVVGSDGIVVSNYHVVQEATDIRVVLADRREFDGEVVLGDPEADIAVIRLKGAKDLPFLSFADSESAEVGDLVLAIGNPFGVGQTVSSGIISATARVAANARRNAGYFLQTDAPINPGNSGGALVDMKGRLVGLNTSILTRSGGSNGIGFAIPSNLVKRYVEQARDGKERFVHAWDGIEVQPVDGVLSEALGQDLPAGVLVTETHPESPFVEAGIKVGDVLVAVGGRSVNTGAELSYRMMTEEFGKQVDVEFLREGQIRKVGVAVGEAPDHDGAGPIRLEGRSPLSGLVVAEATPAMIETLNLPLTVSGVVVVKASGASARLGLRGGDVLEQVNGAPITTVSDIAKIANAGARGWDIALRRGNRLLRLRIRG